MLLCFAIEHRRNRVSLSEERQAIATLRDLNVTNADRLRKVSESFRDRGDPPYTGRNDHETSATLVGMQHSTREAALPTATLDSPWTGQP